VEKNQIDFWTHFEVGREGGREGGKESGREGGREGGRESGREGGRERWLTSLLWVCVGRGMSAGSNNLLSARLSLPPSLLSQVMDSKDTTDAERQYWTHEGVLEEKDWSDNER